MEPMNIENPNVTDYSKPEHWLTLPANPSKPVDIFYVYPTTYHKVDPAEPNYCTIDNPKMIKGAAFTFCHQATAFETAGNIYAPYYRQVDSGYMLTFPAEERGKIQGPVSINDVTAAFEYYIKHYNNGKPFILCGHSQGSVMLRLLLSDYMAAHPEVYARMIAAYVIGYPVTADYLSNNKHLKFAGGPDDTGVIISYNTQSPDIPAGGNILLGDDIGIVINPVNWKRDETLAKASESLGSSVPGADGVFMNVPAYADARIDLAKGVLICSSVDANVLEILYPSTNYGLGVYHIWDYPLYYYNLRENAERRVKKFLGK